MFHSGKLECRDYVVHSKVITYRIYGVISRLTLQAVLRDSKPTA
jgi:hypothetical protein